MSGTEETKIRAAILRVFEACREKPDAPFEESHFLDFLTEDGTALQMTPKGFAGFKRAHLFYSLLQIECGVCLETQDTSINWQLDGLARRIAEKKSDRAAQVALVELRLGAAKKQVLTETAKFGALLSFPAAVVLSSFVGGWEALAAALGLGLLAALLVWHRQQQNVDYYLKLKNSIGTQA